ncbi:hypothetical protein SeMB42_g07921 [Synchytrium endobioticum]|uniref:Uncharacterized protein n=1 Tax=Synchytrium endobioticum TaxID=286115 RepID=A0A507BKU9_9FUNG|nr:hypothetical protein SeMB42_g07921 [Synchytrium endobioticum]
MKSLSAKHGNAVAILNRARALADLLWHITHSTTNYWKNIVRMMITGKLGVEMSATMKQLMERVYNLLGEAFFNSPLGDEIDTVFSLQVVGKVELLKERIVQLMGDVGKESEEALYELLCDIPSFKKLVHGLAGMSQDKNKMETRKAFMKIEKRECFSPPLQN